MWWNSTGEKEEVNNQEDDRKMEDGGSAAVEITKPSVVTTSAEYSEANSEDVLGSTLDDGNELAIPSSRIGSGRRFSISSRKSIIELAALMKPGKMLPKADDIYPWFSVLVIAGFIGVYEYIPQAMLAWSVPAKVKFLDAIIRDYGLLIFTCVHIAMAVGLGAAASALVVYVRPCAAGSGIPPIIEYSYDGRLKDIRTFDWLTVLVKTVGIALIITSGVPVGREGPAIHIGAGVAFIVSGVITRLQNRFKGNEDDKVDSVDVKRKMILYGSAAGFASAFRSPIGGVLYVIEEICTDWDVEGHKSTGGQLVLCAALAAYVTSVIIRATSEGGSDIDFSSIVITQEGQTIGSGEIYFDNDIIGFLVTAIVCGISGGLHTMLSLWFHKKRKSLKGAWKVVDTAVSAGFVALCYSLIPLLYEECQHVDNYDNRRLAGGGDRKYVQYSCDKNDYSPLASLTLSGEEGVIRHLMSRDSTEFELPSLLIFYVFYLPLMAGCMGMAVPQGSFVPNLLLGGLNGRIIGEVMQLVFKNSTISSPGVFAMIGAAAQLGAWTRTMITVVVTMVEITGDVGLIVPMAICTILARQIAAYMIPTNYTHTHVTIKHGDHDGSETTSTDNDDIEVTDKNISRGERVLMRKSTLQTLGIMPKSPSYLANNEGSSQSQTQHDV